MSRSAQYDWYRQVEQRNRSANVAATPKEKGPAEPRFHPDLYEEVEVEVRRKSELERGRAMKVQEQPPENLELILHLLMSPADCDAGVGDLEERYQKLSMRLGKSRADIWYMKQVLTSVWPLLENLARRLGRSAAVSTICFVLRLAGMGGIAGDLKQIAGGKRKRK